MPHGTLDLKRATRLFGEPLCHGQAEGRALARSLGREERLSIARAIIAASMPSPLSATAMQT
jgi:hypothetical protein